MGVDDSNEGVGPGECRGHRFQLVVAGLAFVGFTLVGEYRCALCGAVMFTRPTSAGVWWEED